MPLFFQQHSNACTIAVWHITEPAAFFEGELSASQKDLAPTFLTEARYLQWLASRYLLKALGSNEPVSHTENGKPYFVNSDFQLSISHSGALAGVIISRHNTGLDLQQQGPRILKIKDLFLSPSESTRQDVETLTRIWSAKETVIKLLPGLGLDQMKKIQVSPDPHQPERCMLARVVHLGIERNFTLDVRSFEVPGEKYVLVHAVEADFFSHRKVGKNAKETKRPTENPFASPLRS